MTRPILFKALSVAMFFSFKAVSTKASSAEIKNSKRDPRSTRRAGALPRQFSP